MAYDPAGMNAAAASQPTYDYASAIDPALEAALPNAAGTPYQQTTPGKSHLNIFAITRGAGSRTAHLLC